MSLLTKRYCVTGKESRSDEVNIFRKRGFGFSMGNGSNTRGKSQLCEVERARYARLKVGRTGLEVDPAIVRVIGGSESFCSEHPNSRINAGGRNGNLCENSLAALDHPVRLRLLGRRVASRTASPGATLGIRPRAMPGETTKLCCSDGEVVV